MRLHKALCVALALLVASLNSTFADDTNDLETPEEAQPFGPSRGTVYEFIDELKGYEGVDANALNLRRYEIATQLVDGRYLIEHGKAIDYFRERDDVNLIRLLADFAGWDNRDVRINASLILANVVDNRTLCAVIDRLQTKPVSDNTRVNLLQIVSLVAARALPENREWIEKLVSQTEKDLFSSDPTVNYRQTYELLSEIRQNLRRAALKYNTGSLKDDHAKSYEECLLLPSIKMSEQLP